MPSPFPGMDPYLESPVYWQDFHSRFINVLSELVADALPGGYFAKIEEEIVLLEPEQEHRIRPDVLVGRDPHKQSELGQGAVVVAEVEPEVLHNVIDDDPLTQAYIEIRRLPGREIVTVVELLSPANKRGEGRGIYINKRNRLRQESIHVVELDLLRAGKRIELAERLPAGHYYALVSRADRTPECEVYAWTIRHALPTIAVPLKAPEPDIRVDLGQAFRIAYDRGRYQQMVDYDESPSDEQLSAADLEWIGAAAREKRQPR